jgi:hypothetical protein
VEPANGIEAGTTSGNASGLDITPTLLAPADRLDFPIAVPSANSLCD